MRLREALGGANAIPANGSGGPVDGRMGGRGWAAAPAVRSD